MNKKLVLILAFLASLVMSGFSQEDGKLVGKTDKTDEVLIAPGSLYAFHRFSYSGSVPEKFTSIQLAKQDSSYYLVAQGESSGKIFAFTLKQKENELWLTKGNPVHTCSKGSVDLSAFLFEDGKIKNCKSGDYKKLQ